MTLLTTPNTTSESHVHLPDRMPGPLQPHQVPRNQRRIWAPLCFAVSTHSDLSTPAFPSEEQIPHTQQARHWSRNTNRSTTKWNSFYIRLCHLTVFKWTLCPIVLYRFAKEHAFPSALFNSLANNAATGSLYTGYLLVIYGSINAALARRQKSGELFTDS